MVERNVGGLKKYDSLFKTIFETEVDQNFFDTEVYQNFSESDFEGLLGVAMVMSVIESGNYDMYAVAKNLEININDPQFNKVFNRLRINSIFGGKYNVVRDRVLLGNSKNRKYLTGAEWSKRAWCIIAGVSSGYTGIREN